MIRTVIHPTPDLDEANLSAASLSLNRRGTATKKFRNLLNAQQPGQDGHIIHRRRPHIHPRHRAAGIVAV
jgi:hypothetical protein